VSVHKPSTIAMNLKWIMDATFGQSLSIGKSFSSFLFGFQEDNELWPAVQMIFFVFEIASVSLF